MEFRRRRPDPATLDWAERVTGARVVAWRRMTGGITSAVHRLTVEVGDRSDVLVLRQYEHGPDTPAGLESAEQVRDEVVALRRARASGLPAPELVVADAGGEQSGGRPAVLMTRLPGRPELAPADPESWVRQIAAVAARIHDVPADSPPFRARIGAAEPTVPATATRPAIWRAAFAALREPGPAVSPRFIHRDLQHFNLLWRRGRLTGVVDWAMSCAGPPDVDAGHCRLNLAVLFGADRAERFRRAYQAEIGRAVDPWWDLYALTAYDDGWPHFIPVQVAGRVPVDTAGMTSRVEDLLERALRRL